VKCCNIDPKVFADEVSEWLTPVLARMQQGVDAAKRTNPEGLTRVVHTYVKDPQPPVRVIMSREERQELAASFIGVSASELEEDVHGDGD